MNVWIRLRTLFGRWRCRERACGLVGRLGDDFEAGVRLAVQARAGLLPSLGFSATGGRTYATTIPDGADSTGLAPFAVGDRLLRRPAHRGHIAGSGPWRHHRLSR